ncbi:MAG: site-specific integrase [Planctomycetaceae bacterium]|nr:site-specific integrase [Planctomycetales bacterium]MCB9921802.1 site-specific integrase [Planctomycetaceae bacterium]
MAKPLMGWTSQKRWQKRYRGKLYGVSPHQLGASPTKLGSQIQANAWWRAKKKELDDAYSQKHNIKRLAEVDKRIDELFDEASKAPLAQSDLNARMNALHNERGALNPVDEKPWFNLETVAVDRRERIEHWLGKFHTYNMSRIELGKLNPGRYDSLRRSTTYFANFVGQHRPVNDIDGQVLINYHSHLDQKNEWSASYCRDYWSDAKQFIQYLYDVEALDQLPRNFSNRQLGFKVGVQKVQTLTNQEVELLFAQAEVRTRLFILLMLNCGMTQKDISDLKHTEVDWEQETIQRRRSKTQQFENVPTVTYPLWKETFRLLKRHKSKHKELVIVNDNGMPLVREFLDGEAFKKIDNVKSAWFRLLQRKELEGFNRTLKDLRKTSATRLEAHPDHQSVADYFLGHSGSSVAQRHYKDTPNERIGVAIKWLESDLGIDQIVFDEY